MSLKNTLNEIIKGRHGEVFTLQEMEALCHKMQYKLSNAERRLRESPDIEKVWNEKKTAIIGYRFAAQQATAKGDEWWKKPEYNAKKENVSPKLF